MKIRWTSYISKGRNATSGQPVLIVSVIEINGPREPQADVVSVSTLAPVYTVTLHQSVMSEGISGTSNSCRPIRMQFRRWWRWCGCCLFQVTAAFTSLLWLATRTPSGSILSVAHVWWQENYPVSVEGCLGGEAHSSPSFRVMMLRSLIHIIYRATAVSDTGLCAGQHREASVSLPS